MKFSVFTVSMPEYDIPGAVKVIKELGYDGVEWRVGAPPPKEKPANYTYENRYWCYNSCTIGIEDINDTIGNVKKLCDDEGIEISSLTGWYNPLQIDKIEPIMKAASSIGCRNIRVVAPDYNGSINYNQLFSSTVNQVKAIEKLARVYNVRANFEIHMNNMIPSASAAYRLVSEFDPKFIGVIFDPGNMVFEGYENYNLGLDLLWEYLAHVHIKNAVWTMDKANEDGRYLWKCDWAPLERGCADIGKLLEQLKIRNYEGYVSIEDFSNEDETYMKLKKANIFIRQAIL